MTYLIPWNLLYSFLKYIFLCWRFQTHKNNRKQAWSRVHISNTMGDGILYLAPVPTPQITHPDCDLKTMSAFHSSLWENKHSDPRFFSLVFAKNSLIKNIFQEEKKFDSRTIFFFENSSVLGVFESRRELHANHGTVRKSAISPQPGNQKLIKWSNTAYLNKRSVKILSVSSNKDFCMKVIRILMCNQ